MKRNSFPRTEKRLLLGAGLGVLLLGAVGTVLLSAKKSGAIPPRAPMPKPNGFDLYMAAANALRWPSPAVDQIVDTKKRSLQEAAKFYTPARRAAFVASNAKIWDGMKRARAAQSQHPDVRANIMADLPHAPLRQLARAKSIEAKHFKDLKRWNMALQSGLDTLEMGRDIERGAPIIGSLFGIAIEAVGAASIEDVPSNLSATEAKNGAARLEKLIAQGVSPADVLREEKWVILSSAKNNFATNSKSNPMSGILAGPFTASLGPMMDEFIAQSEKPRASQVTPPKPTGFLNALATTLHGIPQKYGFNAARRENSESSLLLRLALRAYRIENGVYPDNLAQLAPKYLSVIPRDAFGRGEQMRYRKTGDSYLIWSIGPDGKDDGGTTIAKKPGKKRVVVSDNSLGDAVVRP